MHLLSSVQFNSMQLYLSLIGHLAAHLQRDVENIKIITLLKVKFLLQKTKWTRQAVLFHKKSLITTCSIFCLFQPSSHARRSVPCPVPASVDIPSLSLCGDRQASVSHESSSKSKLWKRLITLKWFRAQTQTI